MNYQVIAKQQISIDIQKVVNNLKDAILKDDIELIESGEIVLKSLMKDLTAMGYGIKFIRKMIDISLHINNINN